MTYDMPRNWVKYVCLSPVDCEGNLGQLIAYFVFRAGFPAIDFYTCLARSSMAQLLDC